MTPRERFIDIDYGELVADPIACARRVYAAIGVTLSDEVERRMREWLAAQAKSRGSGAEHQYSLADYGLDASAVDAAFAPYAAFNVRRGSN